MKPIVIIGAGLAGYTVAREFRKLDKDAPLTIITADQGSFYSKPMLSNAFALKKTAMHLVTRAAAQIAAELNIRIATATRVCRINGLDKTIDTTNGKFDYAKLVIATGASPNRLPVGGDAHNEVLSVNHLDDYSVFRSRIDTAEPGKSVRVAIIGAGLIGCEFADDLASAGHHVTLVDPNEVPLAALAPPDLSRRLEAALVARGVSFNMGTTAERIDRRGSGLAISLSDKHQLAADIVLSAIGLRPDLTLAQSAGLAVGRGILVDETGETSMPDIFALGDCAEYSLGPDGTSTLPYIAPIMTAARALACTLSGATTPFTLQKASPIIVKTPCCPLALVPPPRDQGGNWHTRLEGERMICRFYDRYGVMTGFGVSPHDAALRQRLMSGMGASIDMHDGGTSKTIDGFINKEAVPEIQRTG